MMTTTTTERSYTSDEVAAHRREWVAALRSGRFRQDRGKLRTKVGYCCLGVAEEVRGCVWTEHVSVSKSYFVIDITSTGDYETNYLSRDAMVYYGLVVNDPFVRTGADNSVAHLSRLNDQGNRLAQIADLIEAQPASWDGTERECLARPRVRTNLGLS